MPRFWNWPSSWAAGCGGLLLALSVVLATSQREARADIDTYGGYEAAFGTKANEHPQRWNVNQIASNLPANTLWPGEEAKFTFQIINKSGEPLVGRGKWEIIQYGTRVSLDDWFAPPQISKIRDAGSIPATVDVPPGGFVNQTVTLPVPPELGAYAIVLSFDGLGRDVAGFTARTVAANPGKERLPTYAMDMQNVEEAPLFRRLGIKGARREQGPIPANQQDQQQAFDNLVKALSDNDVTLLLTLATGGDYSRMPLGRIRGFLNDKDEGNMGYPGDFAALPQYDPEFQAWVRALAEKHGWPNGPINAVELWNEPWEGMSISGWGADMPRYREIYTAMAQGVEEARKSKNVQVLIGGACSSMNTEDKLFSDGNDEPFLKWLDFTSIHYQPLCPQPVLIKKFAQRKSPQGPTQVWDTESWIANSEDRVAGVIASMRATGLSRCAGVFHDSVRVVRDVDVRRDGGSDRIKNVQPLPPAGAIAAVNKFIGQRPFQEILFKNGLPWVFVFSGVSNPEDGTVVVLGDLGALYERQLLTMRDVLGIEARKRSAPLMAELAALPPDADPNKQHGLVNALKKVQVINGGTFSIDAGGGKFSQVDSFGNPVPLQNGKIVVPLNELSYYIRTDGSAGSFAKLIEALKAGRVDGYEPVHVVARDLLARVESKPKLRLSITNVLNRPISGKLNVKLGNLQLEPVSTDLTLKPHEVKDVAIQVTGGSAAPDNTLSLAAHLRRWRRWPQGTQREHARQPDRPSDGQGRRQS